MVDLPERIWADRDPETNEKQWFSIEGMGVEYVRADLYEQVKRELAHQEKVSSDRFERIERQAYAYDEMRIRAEAAERLAGARVKAKEIVRKAIENCRELNEQAGRPAWEVAIETAILAALAQPAGEAEPSKWSIPGSSYAGASTPPDASAIREAEKIDPVELVQQKIQKLSNGKDAAEYVIATMVTNLKTGKVTVDQLLEWFDGEGRAALAGAKP